VGGYKKEGDDDIEGEEIYHFKKHTGEPPQKSGVRGQKKKGGGGDKVSGKKKWEGVNRNWAETGFSSASLPHETRKGDQEIKPGSLLTGLLNGEGKKEGGLCAVGGAKGGTGSCSFWGTQTEECRKKKEQTSPMRGVSTKQKVRIWNTPRHWKLKNKRK